MYALPTQSRTHTTYVPPSARTGHTSHYDPSRMRLSGMGASRLRPTLPTVTHDTAREIPPDNLQQEAKKILVDALCRTAADPAFLNGQQFLLSFDLSKFASSMSPMDRLEAAQSAMSAAMSDIKCELLRQASADIGLDLPQTDSITGVDPSLVWKDPFPTESTILPAATAAPTVTAAQTTFDTSMDDSALCFDNLDPLPELQLQEFDPLASMEWESPPTPESLFGEMYPPELDENDPITTIGPSDFRATVTSEAEENGKTISEEEWLRLLQANI